MKDRDDKRWKDKSTAEEKHLTKGRSMRFIGLPDGSISIRKKGGLGIGLLDPGFAYRHEGDTIHYTTGESDTIRHTTGRVWWGSISTARRKS